MPTIRIPGPLLALSGPNSDDPWCWETWQSITGFDAAPFSNNAVDHLPADWTPDTASAVRSFARKFWTLPENERIEFMKKKTDNDAAGRETWCAFVVDGWNKTWKAHETIVKLLLEHKVDPYTVNNIETVAMGYCKPYAYCNRIIASHNLNY
jgi:hypothetical protein